MNWSASARNRLTSDQGYEVKPTAINGKVRWLASSPAGTLLEVLGSKQAAMTRCENHQKANQ